MKLTVSKSYVDAEGRVMAVTWMPTDPALNIHDPYGQLPNYKEGQDPLVELDKTLQTVKDTSVVYEDQFTAKVNIFAKDPTIELKTDTFYDHDTVEVEIGEVHYYEKDCSTDSFYNTKKVARILPIVEKPEETQDDLWIEAQSDVKSYLSTYSNDLVCDLARWAIEALKNKYIITRKPLPSPPKP
jgi:hypothetical protein